MSRFITVILALGVSAGAAHAVTVTNALFDQVIALDVGLNLISDSATASCSPSDVIPAAECTPNNDSAFSIVIGATEELVGLRVTALETTSPETGVGSVSFLGTPGGLASFSASTGTVGSPIPLNILNFAQGSPNTPGPLGAGTYALSAFQTQEFAPDTTTLVSTSYTLEFSVQALETPVIPLPPAGFGLLGAIALLGLWGRRKPV